MVHPPYPKFYTTEPGKIIQIGPNFQESQTDSKTIAPDCDLEENWTYFMPEH